MQRNYFALLPNEVLWHIARFKSHAWIAKNRGKEWLRPEYIEYRAGIYYSELQHTYLKNLLIDVDDPKLITELRFVPAKGPDYEPFTVVVTQTPEFGGHTKAHILGPRPLYINDVPWDEFISRTSAANPGAVKAPVEQG